MKSIKKILNIWKNITGIKTNVIWVEYNKVKEDYEKAKNNINEKLNISKGLQIYKDYVDDKNKLKEFKE